jgi:hypothetical protein
MFIIPADDRGFSADVDRMTVGADMVNYNPMPCHVETVYVVGFLRKKGRRQSMHQSFPNRANLAPQEPR